MNKLLATRIRFTVSLLVLVIFNSVYLYSSQSAESLFTTVTPAFQVSENMGRESHQNPAVARLADGRTVIAWLDYRDYGSSDHGHWPDVYARIYSADHLPVGSDFQVNDLDEPDTRGGLNIAALADTGFLVIWKDYRGHQIGLHARRYGADGLPKGASFTIAEPADEASVTGLPDGGYVIAWLHAYTNDLYITWYDNDDLPSGEAVLVSDDETGAGQSYPAVAVSHNGLTLVSWTDSRNGDADTWAQLYLLDGTLVGVNFRVNDDTTSASQHTPKVAAAADSGFVVVWSDNREGAYGIYGQRFAPDGAPSGTNFHIQPEGTYITMTTIPSGGYIVSWAYSGDIFAQVWTAADTADAPAFLVAGDDGWWRYTSSLAAWPDGSWLVTWGDPSLASGDILAQWYDGSGAPIDTTRLVNDDVGTGSQKQPCVAMLPDGRTVVAWEDLSSDAIYAQWLDPQGMPIGANVLVSEAAEETMHSDPSVAALTGGGVVFTWYRFAVEGYSYYRQVYARAFDTDGNPAGAEFMVNEDLAGRRFYDPSVSGLNDGGYVITWRDNRNGDYDIYAQRFNYENALVGANFLVNDDAADVEQDLPVVAGLASGGFVIAWEDKRNGGYEEIYAQIYDNTGAAIYSNLLVNDDGSGFYHELPTATGLVDSGFVISWEDRRQSYWSPKVYFQRYDHNGQPVGSNQLVLDDDNTNIRQEAPSLSTADSSGFALVWSDSRAGYFNTFAQWFTPSGLTFNGNFLANPSLDAFYEANPVVAAGSGKVLIAWEDNHVPEQGWDIFAQQLALEPIALTLDDTVMVLEDSSQIFHVLENDLRLGGSPTPIAGLLQPIHGTAVLDGGDTTITYTPDPNYFGEDIFRYFIDAPDLGADTALVHIIVSPVNDAPGNFTLLQPPADTVAEVLNDSLTFIWSSAEDIESETISYLLSLVGQGIDTLASSIQDTQWVLHPVGSLVADSTYHWQIAATDGQDTTWSAARTFTMPDVVQVEHPPAFPVAYALHPNYPNPFNPSTNIRFDLPRIAQVRLTVYDLRGNEVTTLAEGSLEPGFYSIIWDGCDRYGRQLPSGIYIAHLAAPEYTQSVKMILLK